MKTKRITVRVPEILYKFLEEVAILKFNGNMSEAVCHILNQYRIEKNREILELLVELILKTENIEQKINNITRTGKQNK